MKVKHNSLINNKKKLFKGLSLIEASMVLVLSAVVVSGVLVYYGHAREVKDMDATLAFLEDVQAQIQGVYANHKDYKDIDTYAVANMIGYTGTLNVDNGVWRYIPIPFKDAAGVAFDNPGTLPPGEYSGQPTEKFLRMFVTGVPVSYCTNFLTKKLDTNLAYVEVMTYKGNGVAGDLETIMADKIDVAKASAACRKINSKIHGTTKFAFSYVFKIK